MTTENTSEEKITEIVSLQNAFFHKGNTLSNEFRKEMLLRLQKAISDREERIYEALWTDLHKSKEEAYLTEISIVQSEVKNHLHHLSSWLKPQRRHTPLKMMPASSRIIKEPLGCALIISPWNYPVQLLLNPLVGCISAGCCAIMKPSPYVPHVSAVIGEMIRETFDEQHIAVVQGDRVVNAQLLNQRFDIIFFTGSPTLGRKVMEAAAKHLTPVILELGGKSPCIVDEEANIKVAARRVAWGKTLNAGQTCVAPDYLLIHESQEENFILEFGNAIRQLHGNRVQESRHYGRMVSDKAFDRVAAYLHDGTIVSGGHTDRNDRYIEPTLLTNVPKEALVMQEEIFGPILPMIKFSETEEAIQFINKREKPLALYYFGKKKKGEDILRFTSSGGACINDVIMHLANEDVPFGGVGNSGMGKYHGKESFNAFSHDKAVIQTPTHIDLSFRYMPYKAFRWIKKLL